MPHPDFPTFSIVNKKNRNFKVLIMPVDERIARSVALEQAYVHDVYEQFCDNHVGKPWPKVQTFIEDLEPGSLVCDVGEYKTN